MIGNISPGQLLVIAFIVLLLFGSRRLRHLGSDLGEAFKGFRKALHQESAEKTNESSQHSSIDSREP